MIALCRRIVERPFFQNGILAVIINNLEAVKGEVDGRKRIGTEDLPARLASVRSQLQEIEAALRRDGAP